MATKVQLEEGVAFIAKHKGASYRAVSAAGPDGKVAIQIVEGNEHAEAGRVFTSLSAAGVALTQKKACQGPRFWQRADGTAIAAEGDSTEDAAPPAPVAKRTGKRVINRIPNQQGLPEGSSRWWCNGCMKSFTVETTDRPGACPEGHKDE